MHIYKFRILSDEKEDFIRDIEIKSTQTFESFHYAIIESIEFAGNELASFFICDRKWNKTKEITLIDMKIEIDEKEKNDDFDDEEEVKIVYQTSIMKDSKINQFIEDPHQRMVWEYDFFNLRTLYIELLKIVPAIDGIDYPRCTLKKENILEHPEIINLIPELDDDELIDDIESIENEPNFDEFTEMPDGFDEKTIL